MKYLKKILFLLLALFIHSRYLLAQNSVEPAGSLNGIIIVGGIVLLFIAFSAYQTKKHNGGTFWEHMIKNTAWVVGTIGAICILINIISSGKEKVNEISETVFHSTSDDRIKYTSSSVTLEIFYPKIGVSSTYGIDYSDNIKELEEKIFNELRKEKYSGNIDIKVKFKYQDKYGNEQVASPAIIGVLNSNEIKKYKDYSYFKSQVGSMLTEYIRNERTSDIEF